MITLAHPTIAAYLENRRTRKPDPAADAWFADELVDLGCGLPDFLRLYAGTREQTWTDGIPQEVLALFSQALRGGGQRPELPDYRAVMAEGLLAPVFPEESALDVMDLWQQQGLRFLSPTYSQWVWVGYKASRFFCLCQSRPLPDIASLDAGPVRRPRFPALTAVDLTVYRDGWYGTEPGAEGGQFRMRELRVGPCPACARVYWSKDDDGPEVRDQKRRVLALFGDTEVTREWRPRVLRKKHRYRDVTDPAAYGNFVIDVEVFDAWLEVDGERVDMPFHIDESVRPPRVTKRVPARNLVPPEHLIPGA